MTEGWSVGEVAQKVGLSTHTLRWYEQVGLLDEVSRDSAGRRRYRREDIERLEFLTKMRTTGMPIKDMIRYVKLVRGGDATRRERRELLEAHRITVLQQIANLERDLAVIDFKISRYHGDR